MSRLADVEIFASVVEQGGFTAASRSLGLSKSYVSKRVRALEDRLGAPLLVRNTRKVTPTALGEAFHARARAAIDLLVDAEGLAAEERGTPRGTLRITMPHGFGLQYIAPELARFTAQHPDLHVHAQYTDRRTDIVQEGFDLAIRIGKLSDSDLIAKRIGTSRAVFCASPAYLAARGTPTHPSELERHDVLVYTLGAEARRWTLSGPEGEVNVAVSGRVEADNGDALLQAAEAGLGVGIFPDWLCGPALASGSVLRFLHAYDPPPMGIWAIHPRSRHLLPKVTRFVAHLEAALEDSPWREGIDALPLGADTPGR